MTSLKTLAHFNLVIDPQTAQNLLLINLLFISFVQKQHLERLLYLQ